MKIASSSRIFHSRIFAILISMSSLNEQVEAFFTRYEKRFNDALTNPPIIDVKGVIASFASYFVAASPNGVTGGKNGLVFRFIIPRGFAYYRKIGTKSMKITSLEITRL